ncbi:CHAT domain-containing protein [Catellatospora citrea]|uniref:CHAT domain-containing protein n=1 Tax=Catellatospora citrea TaxID=53366 RepID=A0A8J3KH30_9ACTN|nr:CHAT domain-containing protein [Catellatospora citrea]RKE05650.1 tetratricopeptide repeat protein [Catellatospora citrea]GIF97005.1 CHAT domain-containing protein [Catellatospora citrea]
MVQPDLSHVSATAMAQQGLRLLEDFQSTQQLDQLSQAIERLRQAAFGLPAGSARQCLVLSELGRALRRRHELTGAEVDLEEAIPALTAACMTPEEGCRHLYLNNLANAYADRYERTTSLADLDRAEAALRRALELAPHDDPARSVIVSGLTSVLSYRYQRDGDVRHLDEAVAVCRDVVTADLAAPAQQALAMYHLAGALHEAYEARSNLDLLHVAEDWARRATDGTSTDPDSAMYLARLGSILTRRAEVERDPERLTEAEIVLAAAVLGTPPEHVRYAGYLNEMGNAVYARFKFTGELTQLDRALEIFQTVVAIGAEGGINEAGQLINLGNMLMQRFALSPELATLDNAISAFDRGVRMFGEDDPFLPMARSVYGGALLERSRHSDIAGQPERFLEFAIAELRRADRAQTGYAEHRRTIRNNLAIALHEQFKHSAHLPALEEAESLFRAILAVSRDDIAGRLATVNLAAVVTGRPGAGEDAWDEAGRLLRRAVEMTAPGHVDRVRVLRNLGVHLGDIARRRANAAAGAEATEIFEQILSMPTASSDSRVRAAVTIAELAAFTGDWTAATQAYGRAVDLLNATAVAALYRADRAHALSRFFGLASDAAACALNAGQPRRALELLEHGRGVLHGQSLAVQSTLAALHETAPDLADRFEQLTRELDAKPAGDDTDLPEEVVSALMEQRRRAAGERGRIVEQIRAIDGFVDFLRAPRADDLLGALRCHPVVVLNVSRHRCDALILRGEVVEVVKLPRLQSDTLIRQVIQFLGCLETVRDTNQPPAERDQAAAAITSILIWLWHSTIEPVLDALGFTGAPGRGQHWPRVWWCPTGLLTFLPLHAAGRHPHTFGSSGRAGGALGSFAPAAATIDRVVSSYAPTVRSLISAGARASSRPGARDGAPQVLAVAVPRAAGWPEVPRAADEVEVVRRRLGTVSVLSGSQATRANVLAQLPRHQWLHFAGHGVQDPFRPDTGELITVDSRDKGAVSIADVAGLRLPDAQLAFLGACDTVRGQVLLADEAMHIAGALQTVGFAHVLANMWVVSDRLSLEVTDTFYARIVEQGAGLGAAAHALHDGVRLLRGRLEQLPGTAHERRFGPILWATFVHLGP